MEVKIGEYQMSDFGLHLLGVEIGAAQLRQNSVTIPGKNGTLDLSEALTGYPVFDNATHKLTFDFKDGTYQEWMQRSSRIREKIHGRRLPVVLGDEPFYYDARVSVDTSKINQKYSQIIIQLDAAPYKLSAKTSLDDWLWDKFCFDEDVIRDYRDIAVPGEILIVGDVMPAGCVFECSTDDVTVNYEGVSYKLPKGKSTVPDILITQGDHKMSFQGSGTVSVEYRWGRF